MMWAKRVRATYRVLIGTAVALGLTHASPAGAAISEVVRGAHFLPSGGPVLWGDGVAWGERSSSGAVSLVTVQPGQARRTLGEVSRAQGMSLEVALAGSPERLAVGTREAAICVKCGSEFRSNLYSAPLDGPLLHHAGPCASNTPMRDFDVNGTLLVGRDAGCRYAVYDLAQSSEPQFELPVNIRAPRVAGRYLAWLEGPEEASFASTSDIIVFDTSGQRALYRVPANAMSGPVRGLDVQEDGKVALVYLAQGARGGVTSKVGWASPEDPRLHVLPLAPRSVYSIRLADDQIGFVRGESSFANGQIGVADLAGSSKLLASPVEGDTMVERFDFDGRRLTWVQPGCTNAIVRTMEVTDAPEVRGPRSGCRLRFARPPRPVGHGRVLVALDCRGFHGGCATRRVLLRGRLRSGQRITTLGVGTERFNESRLLVTLRAAAREALRRRGYLRVRATARIIDATGLAERRSTTVVLRTNR